MWVVVYSRYMVGLVAWVSVMSGVYVLVCSLIGFGWWAWLRLYGARWGWVLRCMMPLTVEMRQGSSLVAVWSVQLRAIRFSALVRGERLVGRGISGAFGGVFALLGVVGGVGSGSRPVGRASLVCGCGVVCRTSETRVRRHRVFMHAVAVVFFRRVRRLRRLRVTLVATSRRIKVAPLCRGSCLRGMVRVDVVGRRV